MPPPACCHFRRRRVACRGCRCRRRKITQPSPQTTASPAGRHCCCPPSPSGRHPAAPGPTPAPADRLAAPAPAGRLPAAGFVGVGEGIPRVAAPPSHPSITLPAAIATSRRPSPPPTQPHPPNDAPQHAHTRRCGPIPQHASPPPPPRRRPSCRPREPAPAPAPRERRRPKPPAPPNGRAAGRRRRRR